MWCYSESNCKIGNSDFNKSTPCKSSETYWFAEKGSLCCFLKPLPRRQQVGYSALPLPSIVVLLKGRFLFFYFWICIYCEVDQIHIHAENHIENLFPVTKCSHTNSTEDSCLCSFMRRSCSL